MGEGISNSVSILGELLESYKQKNLFSSKELTNLEEMIETPANFGKVIIEFLEKKQTLEEKIKAVVSFYTELHQFYNSDKTKYKEQFVHKNADTIFEVQRYFLKNSSHTEFEKFQTRIRNLEDLDWPYLKFLHNSSESIIEDKNIKDKNLQEDFFSSLNDIYSSNTSRSNEEIIADMSAEPWHFLFELLQNAIDVKSSKVCFTFLQTHKIAHVDYDTLLFANDGRNFSPMDVWGICSIGQGAKNYEDIGLFGIGFKCVLKIANDAIIKSAPFLFLFKFLTKNTKIWALTGSKPGNFSQSLYDEILRPRAGYTNLFYLNSADENKKKLMLEFQQYLFNELDFRFILFINDLKKSADTLEKSFALTFVSKSDSVSVTSHLTRLGSKEDPFYLIKISKNEKLIEEFCIDEDNKDQLDIKRENGKPITQLYVKIAIPIKTQESGVIKYQEMASPSLYYHFPIIQTLSRFRFLLHSQFGLTTPREAIENFKSSTVWKKQVNEKICSDIAPKCFFKLFAKLTSSPLKYQNMTSVIPFETAIDAFGNHSDFATAIEVFTRFRSSLLDLLRKNSTVPFWWDGHEDCYVPLKNIIFFTNECAVSKEFFYFLQKNFPDCFTEAVSNVFPNSRFEPNKKIYYCHQEEKENFHIRRKFFEELFPHGLTELSTTAFIQVLKVIFEKRKSTIPGITNEQNFFIPAPNPLKSQSSKRRDFWKGYFNSREELKDFLIHLEKWEYLRDKFEEKKPVLEELFNYFLILVQDWNNNYFFTKISTDYTFIPEEYFKQFPNLNLDNIISQIYSAFEQAKVPVDYISPYFFRFNRKIHTNQLYELVKRKAKCISLKQIFALLKNPRLRLDNLPKSQKDPLLDQLYLLITAILQMYDEKKENLNGLQSVNFFFTQTTLTGGAKEGSKNAIILSILCDILSCPIFYSSLNTVNSLDRMLWGTSNYFPLIYKSNLKFSKINENLLNKHREMFSLFEKLLDSLDEAAKEDEVFKTLTSFQVFLPTIQKKLSRIGEHIHEKTPEEIDNQLHELNAIDSQDSEAFSEQWVLFFASNLDFYRNYPEIFHSDTFDIVFSDLILKTFNGKQSMVFLYLADSSKFLTIEAKNLDFDFYAGISNLLKTIVYPTEKFLSISLNDKRQNHKSDEKLLKHFSSIIEIIEQILTCLQKDHIILKDWSSWMNFYQFLIQNSKINLDHNLLALIKQKIPDFYFPNQATNQTKVDEGLPLVRISQLYPDRAYQRYKDSIKSTTQAAIFETIYIHKNSENRKISPDAEKILEKLLSLIFVDIDHAEIELCLKDFDFLQGFLEFVKEEITTLKELIAVFKQLPDLDDKPDAILYKNFLDLLERTSFSLDSLGPYPLIPLLNLSLISMAKISEKYITTELHDKKNPYFLDFNPQNLPQNTNISQDVFQSWIYLKYLRIFDDNFGVLKRFRINSIFMENISILQNEDILKKFQDKLEDHPYFTYLKLLSAHLVNNQQISLSPSKHSKIFKWIRNALRPLQDDNKWVTLLPEREVSLHETAIKILSNIKIFPISEDEQNYQLDELTSTHILPRLDGGIVDFLILLNKETKNYRYLDLETQQILDHSGLDFDYNKKTLNPPLSCIFSDANKVLLNPQGSLVHLDSHIKLVKSVFKEERMQKYLHAQNEDYNNFLRFCDELCILGSGSSSFFKLNALFHPGDAAFLQKSWKKLTNLDFNQGNDKFQTLDNEKYIIEKNALLILQERKLFKQLDLLSFIMDSSEILKNLELNLIQLPNIFLYFCKNLASVFKDFQKFAPVSPNFDGEKLKLKITEILKFLLKDQYQNKILLTKEQEKDKFQYLFDDNAIIFDKPDKEDNLLVSLKKCLGLEEFQSDAFILFKKITQTRTIDEIIKSSDPNDSIWKYVIPQLKRNIEDNYKDLIPVLNALIEISNLPELPKDSDPFTIRQIKFIRIEEHYYSINNIIVKDETLDLDNFPLGFLFNYEKIFFENVAKNKKYPRFQSYFQITVIDTEEIFRKLQECAFSKQIPKGLDKIYYLLYWMDKRGTFNKGGFLDAKFNQMAQFPIYPVSDIKLDSILYISYEDITTAHTFYSVNKKIKSYLEGNWRKEPSLKNIKLYFLIPAKFKDEIHSLWIEILKKAILLLYSLDTSSTALTNIVELKNFEYDFDNISEYASEIPPDIISKLRIMPRLKFLNNALDLIFHFGREKKLRDISLINANLNNLSKNMRFFQIEEIPTNISTILSKKISLNDKKVIQFLQIDAVTTPKQINIYVSKDLLKNRERLFWELFKQFLPIIFPDQPEVIEKLYPTCLDIDNYLSGHQTFDLKDKDAIKKVLEEEFEVSFTDSAIDSVHKTFGNFLEKSTTKLKSKDKSFSNFFREFRNFFVKKVMIEPLDSNHPEKYVDLPDNKIVVSIHYRSNEVPNELTEEDTWIKRELYDLFSHLTKNKEELFDKDPPDFLKINLRTLKDHWHVVEARVKLEDETEEIEVKPLGETQEKEKKPDEIEEKQEGGKDVKAREAEKELKTNEKPLLEKELPELGEQPPEEGEINGNEEPPFERDARDKDETEQTTVNEPESDEEGDELQGIPEIGMPIDEESADNYEQDPSGPGLLQQTKFKGSRQDEKRRTPPLGAEIIIEEPKGEQVDKDRIRRPKVKITSHEPQGTPGGQTIDVGGQILGAGKSRHRHKPHERDLKDQDKINKLTGENAERRVKQKLLQYFNQKYGETAFKPRNTGCAYVFRKDQQKAAEIIWYNERRIEVEGYKISHYIESYLPHDFKIRQYNSAGEKIKDIFIESKGTTNLSEDSVELTEKEWNLAKNNDDDYFICWVIFSDLEYRKCCIQAYSKIYSKCQSGELDITIKLPALECAPQQQPVIAEIRNSWPTIENRISCTIQLSKPYASIGNYLDQYAWI